MKLNRENAMKLWQEHYGYAWMARDFHGRLMYRDRYGDDTYQTDIFGNRICYGWNIHHILPRACGGTNEKHNLICTNILTNEEAEDKITFWIEDRLYQVKRIPGTREHEIVKLEGDEPYAENVIRFGRW